MNVSSKNSLASQSKKQTFLIKRENIEALFLWHVETREGYSKIINRLIEENCPEELLVKAKSTPKNSVLFSHMLFYF